MASKLGNIVFDCENPTELSHFWSDVFGYPYAELPAEMKRQLYDAGLTDEDIALKGVAQDPTGEGPRLFFQKVPERKVVKNRVHIDVSSTPGRFPSADELEAEKDRIVALGATVIRFHQGTWGPFPEVHYVLADPEGNEFCVQ